jgi:hypothetical protein
MWTDTTSSLYGHFTHFVKSSIKGKDNKDERQNKIREFIKSTFLLQASIPANHDINVIFRQPDINLQLKMRIQFSTLGPPYGK